MRSISVCVCTRNRPEELRQALTSLQRSSSAIGATVVSDDSTDDRTNAMLHRDYPDVTYLAGPRRGLGANRNNALRAVSTSHVMFLDDDAMLGDRFIDTVLTCLATMTDAEADRTIVTGIENRNGTVVFPHEQSFLGFQNRAYATGSTLKTIVINSAVFPMGLFSRVLFDEQLIYGSDEVDLAVRAMQAGFVLRLCPEAVNFHFPSAVNRDFYRPYTDASRLYVTFKRYFFVEKRLVRAFLYAALGPAHLLAGRINAEGIRGISTGVSTVSLACGYALSYWKTRRGGRAVVEERMLSP